MGMIIRKFNVRFTFGDSNTFDCNPVNGVKVNYKEILTPERTSYGKSQCVGYDMKFEFNVMNNSNTDIKTLVDALDGVNAQMSFIDTEDDEADPIVIGTVDEDANTVSGGVTPIIVPKIDGNGKYESIYVWCDRIMSKEKAFAILTVPDP